jgi:hypothetical protein
MWWRSEAGRGSPLSGHPQTESNSPSPYTAETALELIEHHAYSDESRGVARDTAFGLDYNPNWRQLKPTRT